MAGRRGYCGLWLSQEYTETLFVLLPFKSSKLNIRKSAQNVDPNNHQVFLCLSNALYGGLYYVDTHNIINIDIRLYYLPVLVFGVAGSYFNFYMTVNSYVGDLSNLQPETRIRRYTLAEASVVLGVMASYYCGYLITKYVGDFYVFVFTTTASTVAFLYGIVRIKNILPQKVSTSSEDNKSIKVNSRTSQI